MKNLIRYTAIVLLSVFIFSCEGEDGAVGPQGEQGAQGEQGTLGPQGEQGPQGETGTANVIYSDWIARDFFVEGSAEENFQGLEVLDASEFNQDTDVVLVFGRRGSESTLEIYPLPYIFINQDEWYGFGLLSATGGLSLQVRVQTLDGGTNLFTFFSDFRYVIIPGGQEKTQGASSIDYENMTYEEVAKTFGIK